MTELVIIVSGVLGILGGYYFAKNDTRKHFKHHEVEAKAKAKAIKNEAEHILERANIKVKEKEIEFEKKLQNKILRLDRQREELSKQRKSLDEKKQELIKKEKYLAKRGLDLNRLEQDKENKIRNAIEALEKSAGMTKDEAKKHLLELVKEESKLELAQLIRKYEKEAHKEAKSKADYIISQAVTRYSGDFAGERLTNTISLPSDEHKGRIIGKDGRNIKSLEQLLGVDVIIDETPGVIVVSTFNLYRRAIATKTIENLVKDGRIHPGRIEDIHKKVKSEFEQKILKDGENVVVELGLLPMDEELMKLIGRMRYRASYGQNGLAHIVEVARLASIMAAEMDGDPKLALRAGLLHDIGKALTEDLGGSHVDLGADICKRYGEHPTVINAIYAHHGHVEPDSIESAAVCAADTLSASRPGARREVLEAYTKRVEDIEKIAMANKGVREAYAINAGREIRVFVDAGQVDDAQTIVLARSVAKEIENKVKYPDKIKVTVIREKREVNYAK